MMQLVGALFFLSVVVLVPVLLRQDRESVERFVKDRGGKVLEIGPMRFHGWRIHETYAVYQIRFLDSVENEHLLWLHSYILGGIQVVEDRIVQNETPKVRQGNNPDNVPQ